MKTLKILTFIFLFGYGVVMAQKNENVTKNDTMQNYDIVIPGQHTPTMRDAVKRSVLPRIIDTSKVEANFDYKIETQQINTDFKLEDIKAPNVTGDKLPRLYHGYIKGGFGNYMTPVGELSINNLFSATPRSTDFSWGLNARHISAGGKIKNELEQRVNSGYVDDMARLYMKKMYKQRNIYSDLGFNRQAIHYYGYNTAIFDTVFEKEQIEQNFMNFAANTGVMSTHTDSNHVNYNVKVHYNLFMDQPGYMENHGSLNGFVSGFYNKEQLGLDLDLDFYNEQLLSVSNNTMFSLKPWLSMFGNKWRVVAGLNMVTIGVNKDIGYHWYPNASLQYNIFDNILIPYVTVSGNLDVNDYMKIAMENPYIIPGLSVDSTDTWIDVGLGLRGTVSTNTTYNFGAKYTGIDHMYFYVNDTNDVHNQFNVIYDDIDKIRFYGELAYKKTSKLDVLLKGNYYIYTLQNEEKPWHLPAYDVTLTARYNLQNKILVNADLFLLGKRYAKSFETNAAPIELKEVVDINLGLEYRYTKNLSAFAQFNNIAAMKYYKWNNYPMQRFNFIMGVTWSFLGENASE